MNEPCPACGHLAIQVYERPLPLRPQPVLVTDAEVNWWLNRHLILGIARDEKTVRYNIDLGKRIGSYDPRGAYRGMVHG